MPTYNANIIPLGTSGAQYIAGVSSITASTAQDTPQTLATGVDYILAGWSRSGSGYRARQGLLSFDLAAGAIPQGSIIESATLKLNGVDFATNPDTQNVQCFLADWDGVGALALSDWEAMSGLSSADWAVDADYTFPVGSYGEVTNNLVASAITRLQSRLDAGGYMTFMFASDYGVAGQTGIAFDDWYVEIDTTSTVPVLAITYRSPDGLMLSHNF